jgi:hypothetical protein
VVIRDQGGGDAPRTIRRRQDRHHAVNWSMLPDGTDAALRPRLVVIDLPLLSMAGLKGPDVDRRAGQV